MRREFDCRADAHDARWCYLSYLVFSMADMGLYFASNARNEARQPGWRGVSAVTHYYHNSGRLFAGARCLVADIVRA